MGVQCQSRGQCEEGLCLGQVSFQFRVYGVYNIIFFDKDTPCLFLGVGAFTGSPAYIDMLNPGHHYLVAVSTYNAAGGGFPEIVYDVTTGTRTPPTPSSLQIIANNPTTIHMTWNPYRE